MAKQEKQEQLDLTSEIIDITKIDLQDGMILIKNSVRRNANGDAVTESGIIIPEKSASTQPDVIVATGQGCEHMLGKNPVMTATNMIGAGFLFKGDLYVITRGSNLYAVNSLENHPACK